MENSKQNNCSWLQHDIIFYIAQNLGKSDLHNLGATYPIPNGFGKIYVSSLIENAELSKLVPKVAEIRE